MTQLGTDIRLNQYGDVSFTADGDLEIANGGALVAQDVRTEIILSPGSCFWAPSFGQGLGDALKGPKDFDVESRLKAAAYNDERVYFDSIKTAQLPDGRYLLSFELFGDVGSEELYFDLKDRDNDLD